MGSPTPPWTTVLLNTDQSQKKSFLYVTKASVSPCGLYISYIHLLSKCYVSFKMLCFLSSGLLHILFLLLKHSFFPNTPFISHSHFASQLQLPSLWKVPWPHLHPSPVKIRFLFISSPVSVYFPFITLRLFLIKNLAIVPHIAKYGTLAKILSCLAHHCVLLMCMLIQTLFNEEKYSSIWWN